MTWINEAVTIQSRHVSASNLSLAIACGSTVDSLLDPKFSSQLELPFLNPKLVLLKVHS